MALSVIVIGAGGNLGPAIMDALFLQKQDFKRIAVLTSPERRGNFSHLAEKGIEVIGGSLTEAESYKGFDVVISLAGNSIMGRQPQMIDAALEAGVRHFYPSEFGGDIEREPFLTQRYFRDKLLTRAHLRAKAKEVPDFKYTFVVCGAFAETFAMYPGFGIDREARTFTFYGDPATLWSFASMSDVARCTVESISIPFEPGQAERTLRIPNGNWQVKDAVRILGEVEGVEYVCHFGSREEMQELEKHYHKTGEVEKELMANQKAQAGDPRVAVPQPWDNELFDFKRLTLEEIFLSLNKRLRGGH